MMKTKAPFFILGLPRSGTTLLRDLLRSHPNIAIPNESHFMVRLYQMFGDPQSDQDALQILKWLKRLDHFQRFDIEVDIEQFKKKRSYKDIINYIYNIYAQKLHKIRWGDKTPGYLRHVPILLKLFPDALLIHIIRDGRDVALSNIVQKFGPNNVACAAIQWKKTLVIHERLKQICPASQYLEVQYEQLLMQPRLVLEKVCGFLSEPFTEEILTATRDGLYTNISSVQSQHIDASNCFKWKSKMRQDQLKIFESIAGDVLIYFGYDVQNASIRIPRWKLVFYQIHNWILKIIHQFQMPGFRIKTNLVYFWLDFHIRLKRVFGYGNS